MGSKFGIWMIKRGRVFNEEEGNNKKMGVRKIEGTIILKDFLFVLCFTHFPFHLFVTSVGLHTKAWDIFVRNLNVE